ncbi:hypothetical protein [Sporolactobacillus laevolacticus]|uniref:DUF3899 domain-containing protein n=1 Tax=Sporolactobacillus laevolacticus DSM 442 TaxID=1395513 RepID=V6IUN4_9BACL|nr:hypothetical protein [Sporolactobacillus laevolacticus]EST10853.1 hypothetical protein P343_14795 [Sporolactobacillus laevolacticus DSM 442]
MIALFVAILFWLAGTILMGASFYLTNKLRETGEHLLKDAEHEKGKDNSASLARAIEGNILEHIPSYVVHMATGVIGALFLAFGFVALAFYVH